MQPNPAGTTFILIRHAERDEPTPANRDPHLNAAGRDRAETLVRVLGSSGIDAIYTSHFVRSIETARPLARHLGGLSPVQLDEPGEIRDDVLANHRGKSVLIVGHSDTVPGLINLLGGGNMPEIDNREFDNLFVVTLFSTTGASVTHLKYGAPG
jgi:broad specificity phosphatase PhoE